MSRRHFLDSFFFSHTEENFLHGRHYVTLEHALVRLHFFVVCPLSLLRSLLPSIFPVPRYLFIYSFIPFLPNLSSLQLYPSSSPSVMLLPFFLFLSHFLFFPITLPIFSLPSLFISLRWSLPYLYLPFFSFLYVLFHPYLISVFSVTSFFPYYLTYFHFTFLSYLPSLVLPFLRDYQQLPYTSICLSSLPYVFFSLQSVKKISPESITPGTPISIPLVAKSFALFLLLISQRCKPPLYCREKLLFRFTYFRKGAILSFGNEFNIYTKSSFFSRASAVIFCCCSLRRGGSTEAASSRAPFC